ncbi:MAG: PLP-dependent aminotransferase family protein [Gemmataceae bacterium]
MSLPLALSAQARRTTDQPITYYMQLALENPQLISLAPGLVDQDSLPVAEVEGVLGELLADPAAARAALQYGTTQGLPALREQVLKLVARLDGVTPGDLGMTADEVVITTGSQQLLYALAETLLDPGDIVVTESPSYFVNHGVLACRGSRVLTVPMDDAGLDVAALERLLEHLATTGELERVKLIYTCNYFQNPSGLTLSAERRPRLVEAARRFSRRHRLLVLEDAAYRELGFAPNSPPSVKSFDRDNRHVIYAGTFSKPCSPGLKTGYALLPKDLVAPLLRLKGIHDFGSSNLNQQILARLMASGAYEKHVLELKPVYRKKCQAMLAALDESFGDWPEVRWTRPAGGMFVWLAMPEEVNTGPDGELLPACMKEGMLYVPGEFCHVPEAEGRLKRNEMRLCYGVEPPERLREAIRRLRRAADRVAPRAAALAVG